MKVFASGSCRLLTSIGNGRNLVTPIHSMFFNFVGINFLGKLHNTKQHIQFIKYINDTIELHDCILSKFLTAYNFDGKELLLKKKESLKKQFNECSWYIFEICSIKLFQNGDSQLQYEHLSPLHQFTVQTKAEILEDLETLINLIRSEAKILFQVHFRPQIIYPASTPIYKRDLIYETVKEFCDNHPNCFIHDPSLLLKDKETLWDSDNHFTKNGYIANFNYIYTNFLTKVPEGTR